jgi:hypothetical protein
MLHTSRGCPAFVSIGVNRCARRAGSFHWTFVIEHSLSIGSSREASSTLQSLLCGVNSGCPVVRTARTRAMIRHDPERGTRLYISILNLDQNWLPGDDRSNAVYPRRGILFDSKIKQLRGKGMGAERGRGVNAVPVTAVRARPLTEAGWCPVDRQVGGSACRASRAREPGVPCPIPVTELGFLVYGSGREARRPKGQRGRMDLNGGPAARPENPERPRRVRLSNWAHRATARPPQNPSSS